MTIDQHQLHFNKFEPLYTKFTEISYGEDQVKALEDFTGINEKYKRTFLNLKKVRTAYVRL